MNVFKSPEITKKAQQAVILFTGTSGKHPFSFWLPQLKGGMNKGDVRT